MTYDLELMLLEIDSLPDFDKQICLQGTESSEDGVELASTPGKYLEIDNTEEQYTKLLYDIPYINSIITKHKMIRTRIMKVKPRQCYYWHKDHTKRLHIPLITNEHCFMVYKDGIVHMPANGEHYIEDTTRYHSFMNASKHDRIHLVGAVLDENL